MEPRPTAVLAVTAVAVFAVIVPASPARAQPVRATVGPQVATGEIARQLQQRPVSPSDSQAIRTLRGALPLDSFVLAVSQWAVTNPFALSFADSLLPPPAELTLPDVDPGSQVFWVPESYFHPLTDGGTRPLDVFLEVTDLRYDHMIRDFSGRVDVWASDPGAGGGSGDFDTPITVHLLADVEQVDPAEVVIRRATEPIPITLRDPDAVDSVSARVVTSENPDGYRLTLRVRPALELRAGADTIQGWGIESVPVTVSMVGRSTGEPVTAELLARPGSVEPSRIEVGPGRPARVEVRSTATGEATVEAAGAAYPVDPLTLHYAFPGRFFLLALLGSLAGIVLGVAIPDKKVPLRERLRLVFSAVVAGVLAVIAYLALGLNFTPVELPDDPSFNESVILVVTALATLAWIRGRLVFWPPEG